MGGILFLIFIGLMMKNPKDRRDSDAIKSLIRLSIILGIISVISVSPLGVLGLFGSGIYLHRKYKEKKRQEEMARQREQRYGWDPQRWDQEQHNTRVDEELRKAKEKAKAAKEDTYKSRLIPASTKGRKKIVNKFNDKYTLDLTEEQVQSIVNSSYMSGIWRGEIEAMNKQYQTVHEWFQGPTNWLRVYMHAFHVQEITSDIVQQENIVMYAFESVFRYVDTLPAMPISRQIEEVNMKFLTSFDDVSFMIAYRFLEAKGIRHELKTGTVHRMDNEVDDLVNKYAGAQQ